MKVELYRKKYAKEIARGLTLFVHKSKKDGDGDALYKTFLVPKSSLAAQIYIKELNDLYGFIPAPSVPTEPIGIEERAEVAAEVAKEDVVAVEETAITETTKPEVPAKEKKTRATRKPKN